MYLNLFCVVLLTMGLFICEAKADPKVKVVATFSILGDIVHNVGGDKIDLTVLVGPDGDAHTFEPTPLESIQLAKADVIFENGLHYEAWIDDLYGSSASKARRVVVTEGVEPLSFAAQDVDPHAWHNVDNVMIMAQHACSALIAVDPANEEVYKKNTENYLSQLADLDRWIIDTLKVIPEEKRKLVTSHDSLGYFARRYGFKVIGAAIPSATTEAEDPSAADTAQLLDVIKSSGVKALFSENIHNAKLIKTLSGDTGIVMAPELYTDALGVEGTEGESYVKMMKHNVGIIAEYLK